MKKIILLIGIIIILFISGCSTYTFTCYNVNNPDTIVQVEVKASNSYDAQDFAMEQCEDRLGGVVINRIE